ncbi:MAG: hypothetical protein KAT91_01675 [Candidatus Aenigmarchaeota archaeon]|nr:hypothetical protein [Candidatus Aenigmarchaeota archaeon]
MFESYRRFDFSNFGNLKNASKQYSKEPNTLPPEVEKVYRAEDVPFKTHNYDASLIDNSLWKVSTLGISNYEFWEKPKNPNKEYTFFSKNEFQKTTGGNPKKTISLDIIYAFSKEPVKTITKTDRQIHPELKVNSSLEQIPSEFNAFLEYTPETIEYLKGNVHPKTGEGIYPVPVGYILKETTIWSEEHKHANDTCGNHDRIYTKKTKETYWIFDSILETLKNDNIGKTITHPKNAEQRVFAIPIKTQHLQVKIGS